MGEYSDFLFITSVLIGLLNYVSETTSGRDALDAMGSSAVPLTCRDAQIACGMDPQCQVILATIRRKCQQGEKVSTVLTNRKSIYDNLLHHIH